MPPWTWAPQLHAPSKDLRPSVAKHNRITHKGYTNPSIWSSKTGHSSRHPSGQTMIFWSTFYKESLKVKSALHQHPWKNLLPKHHVHTSHASHVQWDLQISTAKRMQYSGRKEPRRSARTPWLAKHIPMATHYCRTHRFERSQFEYTKCFSTCKTQQHSVSKEEKK